MSTLQGSLAVEERLRWLSDRLSEAGSVAIGEAAAALGVSDMTIRRDLTELEERGTARRVRGGARAVGPRTFAERRGSMARAKARIAAKLVPMVPAQGAVAFDASSTVMRLASSLGAARDLVVLTNGPETFEALQGQPAVSPLLTGGRLERRTGSLVGPLACRATAQLALQRVFASAAAVSPGSGAQEATLDEAEVKRSMAAGADHVVLAVDSSKLGRRAVAVGLDWEMVDLLVTELDPADARLDPYRDMVELL
ncbi:MAG TPA: DeoR/GlpR family DNA-binding transcription regulator [Acidimicrobiales bacterium]|nr:DeoR/GlpR family DNA-binding transcription regulator [Acidimicrobiales bacterium]